MLNLVLGRKKSGKTEYILNKLEPLVRSGEPVILLVPEQYNFECQRLLLNELGPALSNKVEIYGFTSLCNAILTKIGGVSGRVVDDSMRFFLLSRAVKEVADNLKHYTKYINSTDFINRILNTTAELKQSNISADDLRKLANTTDSLLFKDKLNDIALIMSAFDAMLENKFFDPLDLIDNTVSRMADNSFFSGKTVFIDEFKDFTAAQYLMLERLISGAKDTYIAFCCDSVQSSGTDDIFNNVKKAVKRTIDIAKSHSVSVKEPIILNSCYASSGVKAIEIALSKNEVTDQDADGAKILKCKNPYDELDFVFNKIKYLIRCENYHYNDFVIISRNSDTYLQLCADTADKYSVPCFADNKVSLSTLVLSKFVLSAIKASQSFDSDDIFSYLKTGLASVSYDEICEIENYAFLWSISGKKWLNEWDMNPKGLESCEHLDSAILERLNSIREKIIIPLNNLKFNLKGSTEDMSRAIIKFIEQNKTLDALKLLTNNFAQKGELSLSDYQRKGYTAFITVLDKLAALEIDNISVSEFYELIYAAFKFETVSEIPQTKDEALFGTADRIRPLRPKVVFILGANQDVFPSAVNEKGLFSIKERKAFRDAEYEISDCALNDLNDERFMFYYSAAAATEKVYILYSEVSASGATVYPSPLLTDIIRLCKNIKTYDFSDSFDYIPEAKQPAFEKLALSLNKNEKPSDELASYFNKDTAFSNKLDALLREVNKEPLKISKENATKLYGDDIVLTASKIDAYSDCKFKFFTRYGLGVNPPKKVDFDAMTRGNIVHYALEIFMKNHKDDIGTVTLDIIRKESSELCDSYVFSKVSDKEALDEKFLYMLSAVKEIVVFVLNALNNEFAQSDFKPTAFELTVGKGKPLAPISAELEDGKSVSLKGVIDRVDVESSGKVRIVDYKTGGKDIKVVDLLNGMNLQMLLYLYAVVKNGKELLGAVEPAGVFYFPAMRSYDSKSNGKYIRMNGLIEKDADTVRMMEKEAKGHIVPGTLIEGKNSFYNSGALLEKSDFDVIFKYLDYVLKKIGQTILNGNIDAVPLRIDDKSKCDYCDYKSICRIDFDNIYKEAIKLGRDSKSEALDIMLKETEETDNG